VRYLPKYAQKSLAHLAGPWTDKPETHDAFRQPEGQGGQTMSMATARRSAEVHKIAALLLALAGVILVVVT
jgi:hypothetical protein